MYGLIRPLLFQMDPETSHHFSLGALSILEKCGLANIMAANVADNPVDLWGLAFKNPIGLAAGLDKNGDYIDALAALGFGYIEIGTITPRAQAGNPKPRLFRLPEHQAIINRMGFNNEGVDYLLRNVDAAKYDGVLGINIGKNKDTPEENAKDDYLHCMRKVYNFASYITINISSPNTPGLRSLQYGEALNELLSALKTEQKSLAEQYDKYVPLAVKIAPDLTQEEIEGIAQCLLDNNIDGVIATNTTLARDKVEHLEFGNEQGGLSGAPVTEQSTKVIGLLSQALDKKIPIIGVGGIMSAQDAQEKLDAGASLVQIYTGFIYQGPELVNDIVDSL